MKSPFGYSYPPGCSGPPEQDTICLICHGDVECNSCICPECPECGETGNPDCYKNHGMVKTAAKIKQHDDREEAWAAANKAEAEYLNRLEALLIE